uniref:Uncharacterized protein n=1 Tax=Romanomermis culicivorax TaxID=13658 RepID=A0A915HII1_ROMCU
MLCLGLTATRSSKRVWDSTPYRKVERIAVVEVLCLILDSDIGNESIVEKPKPYTKKIPTCSAIDQFESISDGLSFYLRRETVERRCERQPAKMPPVVIAGQTGVSSCTQ